MVAIDNNIAATSALSLCLLQLGHLGWLDKGCKITEKKRERESPKFGQLDLVDCLRTEWPDTNMRIEERCAPDLIQVEESFTSGSSSCLLAAVTIDDDDSVTHLSASSQLKEEESWQQVVCALLFLIRLWSLLLSSLIIACCFACKMVHDFYFRCTNFLCSEISTSHPSIHSFIRSFIQCLLVHSKSANATEKHIMALSLSPRLRHKKMAVFSLRAPLSLQ